MDQETIDRLMQELGLGKDKDKFMRVKITTEKNFDAVFGADSFSQHWPQLETSEGVIVHKMGPDGWWYIWDEQENWYVNDTAFFTWEDIRDHMYIIRKRDEHGRFIKGSV